MEKTFVDFFQDVAQFFSQQVLDYSQNKAELDYSQYRVNLLVASRLVERLKTEDLRKLRKLKQSPKMLGFDGEYPADCPKDKLCHLC